MESWIFIFMLQIVSYIKNNKKKNSSDKDVDKNMKCEGLILAKSYHGIWKDKRKKYLGGQKGKVVFNKEIRRVSSLCKGQKASLT